ncbi:3-isopropylmalate dehydratase large subunit [Alicycliphilus sp. B1]|nr:3-isopropylmalate dehydratase large subunit [Alicycliphilus sp. B1]
MTPRTLAQKLVGRACGDPQVQPGDIVTCRVDLAMMHDSGGPRRLKPHLDSLGVRVWDPERIVVVTDHYVPATDEGSAQIVRIARDWVREQGIRHFYDEQGICHVVTPSHGHLRPGMFAVGGDSHSCTGGAFGAYMFGIGATEMLGVAVSGEIWLRVPHTIAMEWTGRLPSGVCAKDMMLYMCTRFGMDGGQYEAVEFCGDAVRALSMNERMTLSNMATELGAQAGLIAPDATTVQWLQAAGVPGDALHDMTQWCTDEGAPLLARHRMEAGSLAPQVSAPGSPAQAQDATAFAHERTGHCLHRRLHGRQAGRPAHGGSGVPWRPQGGCGRAPHGGASQRARPAPGRRRRCTANTGGRGRRAAAQCLRRMRGLWRQHVRTRYHRHQHHRAQLHGTHGRGLIARVPGLALHRGGIRHHGLHH